LNTRTENKQNAGVMLVNGCGASQVTDYCETSSSALAGGRLTVVITTYTDRESSTLQGDRTQTPSVDNNITSQSNRSSENVNHVYEIYTKKAKDEDITFYQTDPLIEQAIEKRKKELEKQYWKKDNDYIEERIAIEFAEYEIEQELLEADRKTELDTWKIIEDYVDNEEDLRKHVNGLSDLGYTAEEIGKEFF
jgi:hypothetical protein